MTKFSPRFIGFLQAIGLVDYVGIFVVGSQMLIALFGARFEFASPMLPMAAFLLAFVTSALICGTIVFGYLTYLFLHDKREAAIPAVLWTVFWLIVSIATGAVSFALYSRFLL